MEMNKLSKIIDKKKLSEKKKEYNQIINQLDSRLSISVPLFSNDNEHLNNNNLDSQFKVKEYYSNGEILKKRTEELVNVKIISSQIASISHDIKMEMNEQGIMLNDIEENIRNVDENTNKGLNEIKQIEEVNRKSKKYLYFMCIIIIVLLFLIIYLGYKILK
jgi:hypothetical protein